MAESLHLVGLAEIARLAGVSKQAVTNWRARYPDFPAPASQLSSGPVWLLDDVVRWAQERGIPIAEKPEKSSEQGGSAMAKTVALINMKGGVGKSTLTVNLGWYCYSYNQKNVLLVDLDPQFNLSQYVLGPDRYEELLEADKPTVVDIFEQFTPTFQQSGKGRKRIRPSDVIVNVRTRSEVRLDLIPSKLDLAWTLKNPHDKEHLLRDFIDEVKANYDLVLIDCAPTESMLTTASYMASDYLLVPVRPEFLSTIGLPLLISSLEEFRARHRKESPPELIGILFNHASDQSEHQRSRAFVKRLADKEGWYVFKNEVGFSNSYAAGARAGRPIFLTDYARYWKVNQFKRVAEEFSERIGL